jgi:hypothetical protein
MSEYGPLAFSIFWIVLFGMLGRIIDKAKGGGTRGLCLGVVFGPLGLIISALLPPVKKTEPKGADYPVRPNMIQKPLIVSCECGSKMDLTGLPLGRYECPVCKRHIRIEA